MTGESPRNETVSISGIWLRRLGGKVQVLAESKGKYGRHWFLVIEETEPECCPQCKCFEIHSPFSHVAETGGILDSPVDPLEELESTLKAMHVCLKCGAETRRPIHQFGEKHVACAKCGGQVVANPRRG